MADIFSDIPKLIALAKKALSSDELVFNETFLNHLKQGFIEKQQALDIQLKTLEARYQDLKKETLTDEERAHKQAEKINEIQIARASLGFMTAMVGFSDTLKGLTIRKLTYILLKTAINRQYIKPGTLLYRGLKPLIKGSKKKDLDTLLSELFKNFDQEMREPTQCLMAAFVLNDHPHRELFIDFVFGVNHRDRSTHHYVQSYHSRKVQELFDSMKDDHARTRLNEILTGTEFQNLNGAFHKVKAYLKTPFAQREIQQKKGFSYTLHLFCTQLEASTEPLFESSAIERFIFLLMHDDFPIQKLIHVLLPNEHSSNIDTLKHASGFLSVIFNSILHVWPELKAIESDLFTLDPTAAAIPESNTPQETAGTKKSKKQLEQKEKQKEKQAQAAAVPILSTEVWGLIAKLEGTQGAQLDEARLGISIAKDQIPKWIHLAHVNLVHGKTFLQQLLYSWDKLPHTYELVQALELPESRNETALLEAIKQLDEWSAFLEKQEDLLHVNEKDAGFYQECCTLMGQLDDEVNPMEPSGQKKLSRVLPNIKNAIENLKNGIQAKRNDVKKLRQEIQEFSQTKEAAVSDTDTAARLSYFNRRLKQIQDAVNVERIYHPAGVGEVSRKYFEFIQSTHAEYVKAKKDAENAHAKLKNTAAYLKAKREAESSDPKLKEAAEKKKKELELPADKLKDIYRKQLEVMVGSFEYLLQGEPALTLFSTPRPKTQNIFETAKAQSQKSFLLKALVHLGNGNVIPFLKTELFDFIQQQIPAGDDPLNELRIRNWILQLERVVDSQLKLDPTSPKAAPAPTLAAKEIQEFEAYKALNDEFIQQQQKRQPLITGVRLIEQYLFDIRAQETGKRWFGYSAKDFFKRRDSFGRLLKCMADIDVKTDWNTYQKAMLQAIQVERNKFSRFSSFKNFFALRHKYATRLKRFERIVMQELTQLKTPEERQAFQTFVQHQFIELHHFHTKSELPKDKKVSAFGHHTMLLDDTTPMNAFSVLGKTVKPVVLEAVADEVQLHHYALARPWLKQWGLPDSQAMQQKEQQQLDDQYQRAGLHSSETWRAKMRAKKG